MAWGQYGNRVGVPRILKLLEKHGVKATFYVPAVTALLHPDEQRALVAEGHEIGIHGWIHELNSVLPREAERDLMLRSADTLEKITGVRPVGMRTPSWDFSPNTLALEEEMGLLYDSSLMADEDCYELLLDGEPTGVVELPVEWVRDDAVYFMMHRFSSLRPYTPPSRCSDIFRREFDAAYEEGGIFQLTMHPHIIGYRSRIWIIEELIRHAKSKGQERVVRHPRRSRGLRQGARRVSKTAIVTGGARGIGRGCALELAARGYDIALVDLLEPEMKRTAGEIEGLGREALTYQADVASFARAHEVVADVAGKWGNIDFLLNDAGASNAKGILEIKEEEFDRTIAVNLKSCFNYIHATAPIMLKQETGGRIASMSSLNALSGGVTSAVSKHCLRRGQGGHPRPDAVARQGARTQDHDQRDLPRRDRDRTRQQPDPLARRGDEEGHHAQPPGQPRRHRPAGGLPRHLRALLHHRPALRDRRLPVVVMTTTGRRTSSLLLSTISYCTSITLRSGVPAARPAGGRKQLRQPRPADGQDGDHDDARRRPRSRRSPAPPAR